MLRQLIEVAAEKGITLDPPDEWLNY